LDSDADGLGNLCDLDDDNDGLTDTQELILGTSSTNADTDTDGFDDDIEIAFNSNPLDIGSYPATGDLNEDGVVNAADVLLVTQIVLGTRIPTANQAVIADVAPMINGIPSPDGIINSADTLLITRKALGLANF